MSKDFVTRSLKHVKYFIKVMIQKSVEADEWAAGELPEAERQTEFQKDFITIITEMITAFILFVG